MKSEKEEIILFIENIFGLCYHPSRQKKLLSIWTQNESPQVAACGDSCFFKKIKLAKKILL